MTRPRPVQSRDVIRRRMVLPTIASVSREPTIRVRIAKDVTRAEISGGDSLLIGPAGVGQADTARRFTRAVAVTYFRGAFLVTDTNRRSVRWALSTMRITPASGTPVAYNGKQYPGSVVLTPVRDKNGRPTGKLDIVNHVGMESYLPGVIEHELYGSWEPAAFRAAAIAARSYALFESSLKVQGHYDLESTAASQVYGGRSRNPKALSAVSQTRGKLLEYHGRVVPAFYSSSCGGTGQDAKAAFTWLPDLPNMRPLRGQDHGGWCRHSDKFRWGPVTRSKTSLAFRIALWGRTEGHPVKALRGIRDIRISATNSEGRPTAFAISDTLGMTYTLGPEQFRFACNFGGPKLAKPVKGQSLYSSHMKIRINPSAVTFYDGHGFGHGVGLCQFGTQGLAKAGYNEYSILAFYYPGSRVVQAYK